MSNVSEKVIKKLLLSLNTSKAAEIDQIPVKFLKDGEEVLGVRNIIDLSVKLSTFPEECKIAKLKLIFRNAARTDTRNYRAISLLPQVSKVIEKLIHFQIEDYLHKEKLTYIYQ